MNDLFEFCDVCAVALHTKPNYSVNVASMINPLGGTKYRFRFSVQFYKNYMHCLQVAITTPEGPEGGSRDYPYNIQILLRLKANRDSIPVP